MLVPVSRQMTIDCTETIIYACSRHVISWWHDRALLVNTHLTYQVLGSTVLLTAWRTCSSTALGMGWGPCLAGGVIVTLSSPHNICALSRSASARRQWVSPIHCDHHELLRLNPVKWEKRSTCIFINDLWQSLIVPIAGHSDVAFSFDWNCLS